MSQLSDWCGYNQIGLMWGLTIFSLTALLWLIILFIKSNKKDYWSIGGLFTKILAGITMGLIYKFHYKGGDTFQYFLEAKLFFEFITDHPENTFFILTDTLSFPDLVDQLAYADQPRAMLFTKIITIFYLLSGGNYWVMGIFLSIINFLCVHVLVKELLYLNSVNKRMTSISFYFLPTFVFWTSGLLKESLAVGALLVVVAVCLRLIRLNAFGEFRYWLIILIASIVLWELKYFYAAVSFPLLGTLLLYELVNKKRKIPVYLIPVFLVVGVFTVSLLHYNLNFNHLSDVIYQNYLLGFENNSDKTIQYFHFDGRVVGYLINLPLALFSGLFRPLPFESAGILPFLAAIENLFILVLMMVGLWKSKLKLTLKKPKILIVLFYVISLSVLIAFSTPNFGTLSRYKVAYWPFFVLLTLILSKKSQAPKSLTL